MVIKLYKKIVAH